jgi:hypothetical protein
MDAVDLDSCPGGVKGAEVANLPSAMHFAPIRMVERDVTIEHRPHKGLDNAVCGFSSEIAPR